MPNALAVEGVELSVGPKDHHSALVIDLRVDRVSKESGGAVPAQEKRFAALTPGDEPSGAEGQRHLAAGNQAFRAAIMGNQQV